MPLHVNRTGIAEALAVSGLTIDAYQRRGMPFVQRGARGKEWRYDVGLCVTWLLEQERARALGETATIDLDEARRRKVAAEASLAEYDLAEKRRDMVNVDSVGEMVAREYSSCAQRLRAIPSKLAPMLAAITTPEEARDLLDGALNEALNELASGTVESDAADGAGGDRESEGGSSAREIADDAAPAEADGQRVGRRRKKAEPRGQRRAGPVVHHPS